MRGNVTVPIEYFVWARQSANSDKLIYYDENGTCIEHTVQTGEIENALRAFNGETKAVRRSTGGLTPVQPCQLVLVQKQDSDIPGVRVKVRFVDLRLIFKDGVLTTELMTHTKVVTPQELLEPFRYTQAEQHYVMDFGAGIIPVHVFHFDTRPDGETTAFFADVGEVAIAINARAGAHARIQAYAVPRDCLRWPAADHNGSSQSDADLARENYARLKRVGAETIPDCLKNHGLIEAPTGYSLEEVREFLQMTVSERRNEENHEIKPVWESMLNEEIDYPPVGVGRTLR